jgi:hypothetical protein
MIQRPLDMLTEIIFPDKTERRCLSVAFFHRCSSSTLLLRNTSTTTKYSFNMMSIDGSQSICQHIKWTLDLSKVYKGRGISDAARK